MTLIEDFDNLAKDYLYPKNASAGYKAAEPSDNETSCPGHEYVEILPMHTVDSSDDSQTGSLESLVPDIAITDIEIEPGTGDVFVDDYPLGGIIPMDGDIDIDISVDPQDVFIGYTPDDSTGESEGMDLEEDTTTFIA